MSGGEQQFCLRWNNFQANITSQFEALREQEDFVDVTLACEGRRLQAHKVVLSACSPYFKELFKSNPCPHPIIFMRDCELIHITALLEFMYAGEVNIAQAQLTSFLRTAEALQIRGLTDSTEKNHKSEIKNASNKSQTSQLRNLLCGRLHQQTAKDTSQNAGSSDTLQKTAKLFSQSRKVLRTGNLKSNINQSHNGMSDNAYSSTITGANNDYEMSDDANPLKDNILLNNQDDDNLDYNMDSNALVINENENTSSGKMNPFGVGGMNFGSMSSDFTHEMLEPKIEVPDYNSEDDTRQERVFSADGIFANESGLPSKILTFQGRDMAPSTSQETKSEVEGVTVFPDSRRVKEEAGAGALDNLEGLEGFGLALGRRPWLGLNSTLHHQHRRILAKHDPGPPRLIKLGEGIELLEEQIRSVKWADYRKLTRSLAALLFSPAELATCSVTGQRWSRAGLEERPTKPPLDRHKVQAIISYVSRRFPLVEVSRIKQVLAYKCKENCTALRMKTVSEGATQPHTANTQTSETNSTDAAARSSASNYDAQQHQ